MNTVKRNKKILDYLKSQVKRLKIDVPVKDIIEQYIVPEIEVKAALSLSNLEEPINPDILNNDAVLIETLKLIGLMETAEDKKELDKLNDKRKKIKDNKKELTDFDKILTGIMQVPLKDKKGTK
jgi:hypothetical protein